MPDAVAQALAQRIPLTAPSAAWSTLGSLNMATRAAATSTDGTRIYSSHGVNAGGTIQQTLTIITTDGRRVTGPLPALTRAWTAGVWCNGRHWTIGGSTANGPMDGVEAYLPGGTDGAAGTWGRATSLPIGCTAQSAAAVGTFIYAAGGSAGTTSGEPAAANAVTSVYRYNTTSGLAGTWQTMPPLPAARYGGALVAVGSKLYYLGGGDSAGAATSTVYVYDTASGTAGTWSTSAPLPFTVSPGTVAAVVVGDTIHAYLNTFLYRYTPQTATSWSRVQSDAPNHGIYLGAAAIGSAFYLVSGSGTANVDALDTAAVAATTVVGWSTPAALEGARSGAAVSGDGSRIYASHGAIGATTSHYSTARVIDASGTVSALPAVITARTYVAGVWCNGRHWAIGGVDVNSNPLNVVEAYTPAGANGAAGAWATLPSIPEGLYGSAAAAVGSMIYVAGGQNGSASAAAKTSFFRLDTAAATPAWTNLTATAPLPAARSQGAMVAWNGKLYYLGGIDSSGAGSGTVYVYDPAVGTWSTFSSTGTGINGPGPAAVIGNTVWQANNTALRGLNLTTGAVTVGPNVTAHGASGGLAAIGSTLYYVSGSSSANVDVLDTTLAGTSPYQRQRRTLVQYLAATDPAAHAAAKRLPERIGSSSWQNLGALATPRQGSATSTDGTNIYLSHGMLSGATAGTNLGVSVSTTGSSVAMTTGGTARSLVSGVWSNGRHWAIGGIGTGGTASTIVEAYTPSGANGAAGTWAYPTSLPAPRVGIAVATLGTFIYAAGGSSTASSMAPSASNAQTTVYRYDATSGNAGTWAPIAPLPSARYNGTMVAWNGKVYHLGGLTTAGALAREVYVFDPVAGTWSTAPSLGFDIGGSPAAVVDGVAYCPNGTGVTGYNLATGATVPVSVTLTSSHGGNPGHVAIGSSLYYVSGSGNGNVDTLDMEVLNALTLPAATAGPALPSSRNYAAVSAGPDRRLWVVGGDSGSGTTAPQSTVYRLDPGATAWVADTPLPSSANGLLTCVDSQDRLYAIGGSAGGTAQNTARRLPAPGGTWATLPVYPETLWVGRAVCDTSDRVYVTGGRTSTGAASTALRRFDPAATTPAWSTLAPMTTAREMFSFDRDKAGRLIAAGGTTGGGPSPFGSTERFDPVTETWTQLGALNVPRWNHASWVDSAGFVYVAGGQTGTASTTDTIERLDPATGLWKLLTVRLPADQTRNTGGAVALNDVTVLLAAGRFGTATSAGTSTTVTTILSLVTDTPYTQRVRRLRAVLTA